mmetsp:Transcript_45335/g.119788  ORF Transcript_45335/g.119788 Transcript_45335/m.119788 type:complete len:368 (-) Transcript_45335:699-1802(-)
MRHEGVRQLHEVVVHDARAPESQREVLHRRGEDLHELQDAVAGHPVKLPVERLAPLVGLDGGADPVPQLASFVARILQEEDPEHHLLGEPGLQPLVHLVVSRVLDRGLVLQRLSGEEVQDSRSILRHDRLRRAHVDVQTQRHDAQGELLLPCGLGFHAGSRNTSLQVFLRHGQAIREDHRLPRMANGQVEARAAEAHADARLVQAPGAGEHLAAHGEDHQGLTLAEVHGLEEGRLPLVQADLLPLDVVAQGQRGDPVRRVDVAASDGQVQLDILHELVQRKAPPVDHAPLRSLLGVGHELDVGALPLLRGGHHNPGEGVVQVHEVHVQRLPGPRRLLGGSLVLPSMTVLGRIHHHPLKLRERDRSVL